MAFARASSKKVDDDIRIVLIDCFDWGLDLGGSTSNLLGG